LYELGKEGVLETPQTNSNLVENYPSNSKSKTVASSTSGGVSHA